MTAKGDAGRAAVSALVDEWLELRQKIAEAERAEHPDITDNLGRIWTWKDSDWYRHDSMGKPGAWLRDGSLAGWPRREILENPNYQWCDYCLAHRGEFVA